MLKSIDSFWCFDLDRCLIDTGKIFKLFCQVLAVRQPPLAIQLAQRQNQAVQFDESLDVYGFLKQKKLTNMSVLWADFEAAAQADTYLTPGVETLLKRLWKMGYGYGIMSRGAKPWQRAKLAAARLQMIPTMLLPVSAPAKGRIIEQWRCPSGYQLPSVLGGQRVSRVVLVDDKLQEFDSFTGQGYVISTESELALANNLTMIKSLSQLL